MLTFTAAAIQAMQRDGAEQVFELNIGSPVSKDIELVTERVPTIRTATRPQSRTFELSTLSIQVDNLPLLPGRTGTDNKKPGFMFSEWDEFSLLNSGSAPDFDPILWHKSIVTLKMGVRLPSGATETQTVFTSVLVDVSVDARSGEAELICIDPLARLRRNSINSNILYRDPDDNPDSGDESGRFYKNFPPSYVIYDLLKEAGFGSQLNIASFEKAIFRESVEGFLQHELQLGAGTWWSEISRQLNISNAGLRWNQSGELEHFTFIPTTGTATPAYIFTEGYNLTNLVVRRPDTDVVNSIRIERSDGAGGSADSLNSPIEDHDSIADHGKRSEDLITDFIDDYGGESIASERLHFKSNPLRILTFDGAWDSFRLEIGDTVEINARETAGLVGQRATIYEKDIAPGGVVSFLVMDTILTSGPYLFVDNSQDLNDGQRVW